MIAPPMQNTAAPRPKPPQRPARRRQTETFLNHSMLLEENAAPTRLRWIVGIIVLLLLAFTGWAAVAPLQELAHAEGDVQPRSPFQRIQHLEGGIIADVLVREGQIVQAGDVLLRLDTRTLDAQLGQLLIRAQSLALDLERLAALLDRRAPDFSLVPAAGTAMRAGQLALHDSQVLSDRTRRSVLESQIAVASAEITSLTRQLGDARRRVALLEEERAMSEKLAKKGAAPKLDVIEVKLRVSEAESEISELSGGIARQQSGIAETRRRIAELDAQTRTTYQQARASALRDYEELRQELNQIGDRLARAVVRAPVAGVVAVALAETPGGVIAPGADVAQIAPLEDGLRIATRILQRDIGVVSAGEPVLVTFPAFDLEQLARLTGRIETILPGVVTPPSGPAHFRAFVTLDQPEILTQAGLRLLPGMTARVDIVSGEKTLLEYLFRPLRYLKAHLFSQR